MAVTKIALRQNGAELTPYVSTFSQDGQAQRDFAENYGKPQGRCVSKNVSEGMSQGEIQEAVKNCAK